MCFLAACLKGKLLAENPNHPNLDSAAAAAKLILSRKMQDEAKAFKKEEGVKAKGTSSK